MKFSVMESPMKRMSQGLPLRSATRFSQSAYHWGRERLLPSLGWVVETGRAAGRLAGAVAGAVAVWGAVAAPRLSRS